MDARTKVMLGLGAALVIGALIGGVVLGQKLSAPEIAAAVSETSTAEAALSALRAEHDAAVAEHAAAVARHERAQAGCSASLERLERRNALLEARRRLTQAADELDRRNFGLVEAHTHAAAEALGDAGGELASTMAAYAVPVGADLGPAHEQLRAFAAQIDAQLEPSP